MNKQENEKWLDELISDAINTTKPQFDVERWKQKYPDEFQTLLSRATEGSPARQPSVWGAILRSPIAKLAAAAVIILAIGLLAVHRRPVERIEPAEVLQVSRPPAEFTTFASLSFAYRQGGMEMVEQMCDKALTMAGPRPAKISMQEFFEEINNGKSERTEL